MDVEGEILRAASILMARPVSAFLEAPRLEAREWTKGRDAMLVEEMDAADCVSVLPLHERAEVLAALPTKAAVDILVELRLRGDFVDVLAAMSGAAAGACRAEALAREARAMTAMALTARGLLSEATEAAEATAATEAASFRGFLPSLAAEALGGALLECQGPEEAAKAATDRATDAGN